LYGPLNEDQKEGDGATSEENAASEHAFKTGNTRGEEASRLLNELEYQQMLERIGYS